MNTSRITAKKSSGSPAARVATSSEQPTIAAIATAIGPAGVCIVRVSGPAAHRVGRVLCPRLTAVEPRRLVSAEIVDPRDGAVIDSGLVVFFAAPQSFTGEDVVELHGHGGTAQARHLLEVALAAGAQAAGPGEFSRRAVLNGRLDLAQAEGVAELIAASSEEGLRAARGLMGGALSRRVDTLLDQVEELLAQWEGALDFPEDLAERDEAQWTRQLPKLRREVESLRDTHRLGKRLREGPTVVLVGAPNAGKSSLFNALVGYPKAIVDAAPGTTRDPVEASVVLGAVHTTLVDCAGLREGGSAVEAAGMARTEALAHTADRVVAVFDTSEGATPDAERVLALVQSQPGRCLVVWNKIDLGAASPAALEAQLNGVASYRVSAKTGEGIAALAEALGDSLGAGEVGEGEVVVTLERHHAALEEAVSALGEAENRLASGVALDAACEELRATREALCRIVGRGALPDEILDRVFAQFCIGK